MKKVSLIILVVIIACIALVGCSSAISASKVVKFTAEDITKITVSNENGITKSFTNTEQINSIFTAFNTATYKKFKDDEVATKTFVVVFELKGEQGVYTFDLANGATLSKKAQNKSAVGNYRASNEENQKIIVDAINAIFY
ncbi:MAG: hypothetical protein RR374_02820 [Clostridia bacterium]